MSSSTIDPFKNFIGKRILKYSNFNFVVLLGFTFVVGLSSGYYYKVHVINQDRYIEYELSTRAYKVVLGDKVLGYVRDKSAMNKTITKVQEELSEKFGAEVVINKEFQLLDSHADDNNILSVVGLENAIKSNLTYNVNGFAVKANGETLVVLQSEELAKNLLNDIKSPFTQKIESENSDLSDVKFLENIEIVETTVPISKVEDYNKALNLIMKGTDEEKIHIVEKGDTVWGIASRYNITVEELERANPDMNPKLIRPDDKLSLIVPKPYVTVVTYEEKTYKEDVKYETTYKNSSSLYKDQTRVQTSGKHGTKEVVAKVEKHNGVEVSKEVLSEKLVKEPRTAVVLRGTKAVPPVLGSGVFKTPTSGRLTSAFGTRWGNQFHHGIDLASRVGTPIKAADSGVVTFAGWKYPYGYMVEISHGGGFTTRYGHASKLYVKKGDKVSPRETIAAVGNTGVSTGPHVHFEIRKYGVAKNPYSYLNKKYK